MLADASDLWYNVSRLHSLIGGIAGGTGLAQVLCTGAALRRPSAWPSMQHREGCFSPAFGQDTVRKRAAWNYPAGRGPAHFRTVSWPAGL